MLCSWSLSSLQNNTNPQGMSFEGAAGYHYQGDKEVEDDAGVERSATVEFTLGDPDPLDVFDVEVYLHPDYGTLVFHTSSGQSSCPHEPNTVHLERPGISILKRPLAPVLPDEPAGFELLLTNDGPRYSDFNLFMLNSENQDSLGIFINTQELATSIDFEGFPPGARYVTAIVERGVTKYKYDPIPLGAHSPATLVLKQREEGRGGLELVCLLTVGLLFVFLNSHPPIPSMHRCVFACVCALLSLSLSLCVCVCVCVCLLVAHERLPVAV